MAFTAPTTRATDYLVTAAVWNAEHVDNWNTAVQHLVVRKTSDESVTSSTTLQNDDQLLMAVGANEVWQYEALLLASGAFDLSVGFSFPASGTLTYQVFAVNTTGTVTANGATTTTTPTGSISAPNVNDTPNTTPVYIRGVYVNAGTAGNLQLMWAQASSGATATIVKAQSTLWAVKLA